MDKQTATPTVEQVHEFLRRRYQHDRFEGRNNSTWGEQYSRVVAASHLESLEKHGSTFIGHHEAANGQALRYTAADVIAEAV